MSIVPVVRYMILCEDWGIAPNNPLLVDIRGLLTIIHSIDEPPYPLNYQQLCVYLALTEARGHGTAQVVYL
jgi:hypothetical protein